MKRPYLLTALLLFIFTANYGQDPYFPPHHSTGEWATLSPTDLGWEADSIDALYDFLEAEQTKSFLLLKDGKIVLENYFGTYTRDSIWPWYSAGKSLRALLVGIAQEEGLLDINDSTSDYLGQGWTSLTPEREDSITIRNQLTMSSGLNVFISACTDPACLTYNSPVNTRWVYHNAPYSLLKEVLEAASGVTLNSYTNTRFENPIGGSNGFWVNSGYNNFYLSKARQMARYGVLIQNGGVWDGTPVISDTDYFNQMLSTSQPMNPSYGYLWWLNGQESYVGPDSPQSIPGPMAPDGPADVVLAAGYQGQFLSVSRETGLLFVRQGTSSDTSLAPIDFHNEIWRRIMTIATPSAAEDGHATPSDLSSGRAGLQVYPNPTSGNIQFTPPAGDYRINVVDSQGRVLFTVSNQAELNLSALPAGRYHLRLVSEAGVREGRVVKY